MIEEIYHSHNGVDGYRSMAAYLERRGYGYSQTTIHKYMNGELGLYSIVRPKRPGTKPGKPHKVFDNKLNQDFHARADPQPPQQPADAEFFLMLVDEPVSL